jgi:cyclohexa-1,5-dienecarbonyl-CoA hydratase
VSEENGGVRREALEGGAVWRVILATPKANILDLPKIERLTEIFESARGEAALKAVLIGADGPHFSFGASVEEHLPGTVEGMIPAFGILFDRMLDASVAVVAAVRGQCVGGGLELASFAHRVVAAPDAKLGQPEILLGVFAPVASVFLPERIGRGAAEGMLLSGASVGADEALRIGLVDEVADDPDEAALGWIRTHLLPKSASSLRFAVRAAREGMAMRFRTERLDVERFYLAELMKTDDALEGLHAFLEKRKPAWRDA